MAQLLERERDLERIAALLQSARDGSGGHLVVEGPAGIGKTRLLDAARESAREQGLQVLSARGAELESEFAFGVVRQLFEPVLAATAPQEHDELFAGAAAPAREVLAGDGASTQEEQPFAVLNGLHWLALNLAARRPTVLVVDDVHWADPPSLRFLLFLERRLEDSPLLVLLGIRTGEVPRGPGLLEQLLVEARDSMHPQPLSPDSVAALARQTLLETPAAEFVAACHAATGGNPFLLRELLKTLLGERVRPTAAECDRVAELGPKAVARAILRRVARLPAAAGALAEALAILGGHGELAHAADLAGLDPPDAEAAADALAAVEILTPARPPAFVHPLVRAAIYADLAPGTRAEGHARAAEALLRAGAPAEVVAAHLVETAPRGDAETVRLLQEAAAQAAARGAPEAAVRQLRRALAEPAPDELRGKLLFELGIAELGAGQHAGAVESLQQALGLELELDQRVSAVLLLRQVMVMTGDTPAAARAMDEYVSRTPAGPERDLYEAAAVGSALLDFSLAGEYAERIDALCRAAETGERPDGFSIAVASLASVCANRPVTEALALARREEVSLAELPGMAEYSRGGFVMLTFMASDQQEESTQTVATLLERARRRGALPQHLGARAYRSRTLRLAGRLLDAERDARIAIEEAKLFGGDTYFALTRSSLSDILVETGQLEEADALLEGALPTGDALWDSFLALSRARLRAAQRRHEEVLQELQPFPARWDTPRMRNASLWPWRSESALALLALGRTDEARALADEELVLARAFGAQRSLALALRAVALAAGGREGLSLLRDAEAVCATANAPLDHARVMTDLGAALRRANQRAEARKVLRRAVDAADRMGARTVAEHALTELKATGARPRSSRLDGVEALTASERRVADMAAEGMSNQEIAQALFLTRRTVETHLTHAYQKLSISSRAQLGEALAASGEPEAQNMGR